MGVAGPPFCSALAQLCRTLHRGTKRNGPGTLAHTHSLLRHVETPPWRYMVPQTHHWHGKCSRGTTTPSLHWQCKEAKSWHSPVPNSLQIALIATEHPRTEPRKPPCTYAVPSQASVRMQWLYAVSSDLLAASSVCGRKSIFKSYFSYKSYNPEWYFCFAIVHMYIYSLLNTIQYNSVYCLLSKNSLDRETCYLKHMLKFYNGISPWQTVGQHCRSQSISSLQQCGES